MYKTDTSMVQMSMSEKRWWYTVRRRLLSSLKLIFFGRMFGVPGLKLVARPSKPFQLSSAAGGALFHAADIGVDAVPQPVAEPLHLTRLVRLVVLGQTSTTACHLSHLIILFFSISFWTQDLALQQILSSIDLSFPTGLIPRTLRPSNDFTLFNGWICLHGVLH